ncbi:MAG: ACP S-malonyltransferase [Gammaproteobacteria bacterium]|nr:ACP S-malonyltransferase [Gammaproteobacteria bacterium]
MNYALVFPGQGSQSVGMLGALIAEHPLIKQTLIEAEAALGWNVAALIANGPESELNRTERTQPAMLAAGVGLWRAWRQRVTAPPLALAGHSLGEYTALVAAGVIEFAAALRLVELRGRYMQQAVDAEGHRCGMAAVLGLGDDAVEALCTDCPAPGWLAPANYNAPGQVVVAGNATGLTWLSGTARARGARKVVELAMSVPSHCPIMRLAAERLAPELAQLAMQKPTLPVIQNLDGGSRDTLRAIREALTQQLYRPVRWTACVRTMHDCGARAFGECGPGKALIGLGKRICTDALWLQLDDPRLFEHAVARIAATEDQTT